jgi:hypothetical protein
MCGYFENGFRAALTKMTKFVVTFRPHISASRVEELAGILGFEGLVEITAPSTVILDVGRRTRVERVATTLSNWDRMGWLTWTRAD